MTKKHIILILVLILLGGWAIFFTKSNEIPSDPLNITYAVGDEEFTLINGSAEKEAAPNSATKNTLSIFSQPVFGDIDEDGDQDAIVILFNNPGGSGTFYYATIAVNQEGTYTATDSILLGDRVIPHSFLIEDNRAKIKYLTREFNQPFSTEPTVERELHLQFDHESLRLIQVEVNFEGEADPDVMTLEMKTWKWIKTVYNNDTEVKPRKLDAFTMTFREDHVYNATTDCNSINGGVEIEDNKITFGPMAMTEMYCEGSQEQEFVKMLEETQSYLFTTKGELVFELKFDSGSMIFK